MTRSRSSSPLGPTLLAALLLAARASTALGAADAPPAPSPESIDRAIRRGIAFLVKAQNKNGSWGSAHRTKDLNIFAPVPGAHDAFRAGTSALCVEALIEVDDLLKDPAAHRALERGETWLLDTLPKLRRADAVAIYNVWGHAYGIQALAAMHRRAIQDPARRDRIREIIRGQIDLLGRYESVDGGWGYYDFSVGSKQPATDSTPFVSATILIAFHEAREIGVEIPAKLAERALASIRRQQKNDYSYLYGEYLQWRPMLPINRPGGSLGRSQACNLALKLWGDTNITQVVFTNWLDRLITRNGWLDIGRKRPVPHESWFQVAAYFFYYGHYYAARCIQQIDPALAPAYQQRLANLLLPLQEKDGSWWDFPFYDYHQPYGTAYAVMALRRCRPSAPSEPK